jgi:AraC-type transcriptional regulator N-terminus
MLSYDPYSYLLASVHIPAKVKIQEASKKNPYLSLKISFSMEQIFDVLKDIDNSNIRFSTKSERGLYIGDMSTKLIEPILRLTRLLDSSQDIPVLSPLIIKEILYIIMRDRGGDFIRQYVMDGSAVQRVVSVIAKIKQDIKTT